MKNLKFPFVMLVELGILAAFIAFLVYLFPTLDPKGYIYYGDAPHVAYLQQYVSYTAVTAIRWIFYIVTAAAILFMLVTIIGELIRWRINQGRQPHHLPEGKPGDEQVTRFNGHFKIQHYLIMIFVTLAGIIGLLQAFPDWGAGSNFLNNIWGSLADKRHFHHYFAYVVDFTVFYFLFYLAYKFFIKKEKMRAMLPGWKDIVDMIHMNLYIFGFEKEEPDYDRFTFGQKIDFFIILFGIPTLSVTGLAMHYTTVSQHIIGGLGIAIAAVIHRSVALFLAWFVLSVHIYYAHLSPDLFPINTVILTGKMPKSRYKALFPLDSERTEGDK
ncbi:MAG: cytochrome b/b6 domain-containing protein [Dehalococcoidales bacterium]|jgi:cytochrome b subunit of formate dehydrogenase